MPRRKLTVVAYVLQQTSLKDGARWVHRCLLDADGYVDITLHSGSRQSHQSLAVALYDDIKDRTAARNNLACKCYPGSAFVELDAGWVLVTGETGWAPASLNIEQVMEMAHDWVHHDQVSV
jgi:hypothetical protein